MADRNCAAREDDYVFPVDGESDSKGGCEVETIACCVGDGRGETDLRRKQ